MEIINKFDYLLEKGYEQGITYKDYIAFIELKNKLENKGIRDPKEEKTYKKLLEVINFIRHSKLTKKFSDENFKYIKNHSDLLPLVIADTTSNYYLDDKSNNSVLFNCPFHDDEDNYLIVMDLNNKYACRLDSCGTFDKKGNFEHTRGDSIDYLKAFNRLNIGQTLELLCHIYNYKIPYHNYDLMYLADHYKAAIKSDDYDSVLLDLEERLYEKDITEWNNSNTVEELYKRKQETISRIFKNEYDPNFKYDAPPKSIKLIKK